MEPAITTGSLVMIAPAAHYNLGDVVTFESRSSDVPTTHRIVDIGTENGQNVFTTKGDANEEVDTNTVVESDILGKVRVAVPYAGFILDFARQPLGFSFLIVLPALMIVFSEIEKIWKEIRRRRNDKNDGTPMLVSRDNDTKPQVEVREIVRMIEIERPVFSYQTITHIRDLSIKPLQTTTRTPARSGSLYGEIIASVCVVMASVCFVGLSFVGSTVSYFNDTESSLENVLEATALDFNVLTDGEAQSAFRADFNDGDGTLTTVVEGEDESAKAKYTVAVEKMGGTDTFCNAILTASNAPITYDGPLLLLAAENVSFDGPWEMSFSIAPDVPGLVPNEICLIDIVYTAWNADSETGVGYSDVERIQLEFYAPTPAPDAPTAFSLPEETELLLEEDTVTNPTTEPVIPPPSENPESTTEGVEEQVLPPAEPAAEEASGEIPEPPEEAVSNPDPSPEPADVE